MPLETILDLSKYLEKPIRVKFSGGREGLFKNEMVLTVAVHSGVVIFQILAIFG